MSIENSEKYRAESVICFCNNVTVAEFLSCVRASGHEGFEKVLTNSRAGTRCTACLLDAEHLFVNATKFGHSPIVTAGRADDQVRSFRHKVWSLLDRISPASPFQFDETSPVLRGPGLDTSICVANDNLSYTKAQAAPILELEWSVVDGGGNKLHLGLTVVEPGAAVKIPVSQWLPETSELALGTVRLRRRFRGPGIRGTTRPQILLEGSGGCCAVHVQGPSGVRDGEFNLLCREFRNEYL